MVDRNEVGDETLKDADGMVILGACVGDVTRRSITHSEGRRLIALAERISWMVLRSKQDAEDCAGVVLAELVVAERREDIGNREAWIVKVAQRRAIDMLRHRLAERRAVERLGSSLYDASADETHCTSEAAIRREELERLTEAIGSLPPKQRDVLMAIGAGKRVEEVASELGISYRSASSHLFRGRKALIAKGFAPVVGLLSWILRPRKMVVAALAVASAVSLLVLLTPDLQPSSPPRRVHHECAACAQRSRPAALQGASLDKPSLSRETSSGAKKTASGTSQSVEKAIVSLPTRKGPIQITEREHNDAPNQPVPLMLWCIQHFSFNSQMIGC